MIIIADSGSTKTDWKVLIPNDKELNIKTIGLNPYFLEKEQIQTILKNEVRNLINIHQPIDNLKVYFYGAGCGTEESKLKINNCLNEVFQNAVIQVEDDMLGAARGVGGENEGVVGILGTGSNACLYQKGQITQRTPSNGIWFGDFGSAGNLGKCLITGYLNQDLPADLVSKFEEKYIDRRAEILERVYSKSFPNQYLATFSHFIYENLSHPFIEKLVDEQFGQFFDFTLKKIPNASSFPYFLVGSVAIYYEDVIRKIALSKNIEIQNIINNPIEGLAIYHQKTIL
jgi:N-acetylglucosamine kinase-like BadF-type ATPase